MKINLSKKVMESVRSVNELGSKYFWINFPRNKGSYTNLDPSEVKKYEGILSENGIEVVGSAYAGGYDTVEFWVKSTEDQLRKADYSEVVASRGFLEEYGGWMVACSAVGYDTVEDLEYAVTNGEDYDQVELH